MNKKPQTNDLTQGPVFGGVIMFMLPLLGSSLVQQLYNTVDIIFIGQFLDKNATAAVGSGSLMITLLLGFFTGFSVGAGIIAANYFGARRHTDLHELVHTTVTFALVGGVVLTVIAVAFAPNFLQLLNTPESIMPLAVQYTRIYFISILSTSTFNLGAGLLRAVGDSRNPMIYQLCGGIGNVIADALFIALLGFGVRGAAAASVVAQTIAAFMVLRKLANINAEYHLSGKNLRIYPSKLKAILRMGIPSAIQGMLITFSNLFVQANINTLSITGIAAFTAYFKVENFVWMPCGAFGSAAMTFVAQNVGAGQADRARKGIRVSLASGVVVIAVLAVLIILFSSTVFSWFSSDADVIALGGVLASISFPFYFIYVFIEVFSGAIRGCGSAVPTMVIILVTLGGARMALVSYIMSAYATAQATVWVYPITWALAAMLLVAYYFASRCIKKAAA